MLLKLERDSRVRILSDGGQPQQQLHSQEIREQAQAAVQRLDAAQNDEEKADARAALRRAAEEARLEADKKWIAKCLDRVQDTMATAMTRSEAVTHGIGMEQFCIGVLDHAQVQSREQLYAFVGREGNMPPVPDEDELRVRNENDNGDDNESDTEMRNAMINID